MATATGLLKKITITPTIDTSIYADGDVLFTATAIPDVFASNADANGGDVVLNSIEVFDKDDEAATEIDLVFCRSSVTTAAANAAFAGLTDAHLTEVEAVVTVDSASDTFFDAINGRYLSKQNLGIQIRGGASDDALYVFGINRTNTPTYSAATDLVFKFGFTQD